MAAEIERQGKVAPHIVQPLDQTVGDFALEEGAAFPVARCPLASGAQDGAIEDQQGVGKVHDPYVGRKRGGG